MRHGVIQVKGGAKIVIQILDHIVTKGVFCLGLLLLACGSDDSPAPKQCRPLTFEVCAAECGRGVRRCHESGRWEPCECALLDSGVADAN